MNSVEVVAKLRGFWAVILGHENFQNDTPFGDAGGDSEAAADLTVLIEETFRTRVDIIDIFSSFTINALAELIRQRDGDEPNAGLAAEFPKSDQAEPRNPASNGSAAVLSSAAGLECSQDDRAFSANEEDDARQIAIVGLACRLPDADDVGQFWSNLKSATISLSRLPAYRAVWPAGADSTDLDVDAIRGGFIRGVSHFAAGDFGISPREALRMCPQQRLLLEVAAEALRSAGMARADLAGRKAAVYVGATRSEYDWLLGDEVDFNGNLGCHLANRISYCFDLKGPSEVIDTACSASLVAIHRATRSLRAGECDLALAGGANVFVSPLRFLTMQRNGMLSPNGDCRPFDAQANGMVPGEGVVLFLLKRLGDARRDGDFVHAVIRGSAVTSEGRTNGINAPNSAAQAAVIKSAWADANVRPEDLTYVETHGTGTPLGDPVEIAGLAAAFSSSTGGPVRLGALKANIGHLEWAAGAASLLKAVLCLRDRWIPANPAFERINPKINLIDSRLEIAAQAGEWGGRRRRIAGVSAFGAGGTICHLVVQESPPVTSVSSGAADGSWLFPLSAHTPESLETCKRSIGNWIVQDPTLTAQEVSFALLSIDHSAPYRFCSLASSITKLCSDLSAQQSIPPEDDLAGDTQARLARRYLSGEIQKLPTGTSRCSRLPLVPAYPCSREAFWPQPKATDPTAVREFQDRVQTPVLIPIWQHAGFSERPAAGSQRFAIFATPGSPAALLATKLAAQGHDVFQIIPCAGLSNSSDTIAIDIASPTSWHALCGNPAMANRRWVWMLDAWDAASASDASALVTVERHIGPILEFSRHIANSGAGPTIDLTLLTCGAYAVPGDFAVRPEHTALAGFLSGAGAELGLAAARHIDLPHEPYVAVANLEALANEVVAGASPIIALRGSKRYERRWSEGQFECSRRLDAREWTVLVTGGLGDLGRMLIEHLVHAGCRRIVVTRRPSPAGELDLREALLRSRIADARLVVLDEDVARPGDLYLGIERAERELEPINSVFHLAGMVKDASVVLKSAADFDLVLAPKITGATVLARLFASRQLDRLIFYSSATGVFGNPGQIDYGTANAYLDGLANKLHLAGVPATSIDWAAFKDAGIAQRGGHLADLVKNGFEAITHNQARAALNTIMTEATSFGQVLVGNLKRATGQQTPSVSQTAMGPVRAVEEDKGFEAIVRRFLGNRLETPPESLSAARNFFDIGVNSLDLVALTAELHRRGCSGLTAAQCFEHGSIQDLVLYLDRHFGPAVSTGRIPPAASVQDGLSVGRGGSSPTSQVLPERRHGSTNGRIAVVGLACRFPGAPNPKAFWRLIEEGRSAISELKSSRWNVATHYSSNRYAAGKTYSRWAGLIDQVEQFDPLPFGILPPDADAMDPQQRMALELSWRAMEDAGYAPFTNEGRPIGVFMGIEPGEYGAMQAMTTYSAVGGANTSSMCANRISYIMNLDGPSLVVDTACSSSAMAVHLACQSLLVGECDQAIAGGVKVLLSPRPYIVNSMAQMLSASGSSQPFAKGADGYVRGEGGGIIVLKPLDDAVRDGDFIRAVILATATNHDGNRKAGLTAPSPAAQAKLLRRAWHEAGIDQIEYLEAHGTGTKLGDPIELRGLAESLRDARRPCALGAVKANIGHLEAAAGIAGIIKTILVVEKGMIPPIAAASQPTQEFDWASSNIRLPAATERIRTDEPGTVFAAGASAFSYGGANVHVVVGRAPRRESLMRRDEVVVVPFSAVSPDHLRRTMQDFITYFARNPQVALADVAFTLSLGRAALPARACFVVSSMDELVHALHSEIDDDEVVAKGPKGSGAAAAHTVFLAEGCTRRITAVREEWCELPSFVAQSNELGSAFAVAPDVGDLVALARLWADWLGPNATLSGAGDGAVIAATARGDLSYQEGVRQLANEANSDALRSPIPSHCSVIIFGRDLVDGHIDGLSPKNRHSVIASLFRRGLDVNWAAFQREVGGRRISLPGTHFLPKRHWYDDALWGEAHASVLDDGAKPPESRSLRISTQAWAPWVPQSPANDVTGDRLALFGEAGPLLSEIARSFGQHDVTVEYDWHDKSLKLGPSRTDISSMLLVVSASWASGESLAASSAIPLISDMVSEIARRVHDRQLSKLNRILVLVEQRRGEGDPPTAVTEFLAALFSGLEEECRSVRTTVVINRDVHRSVREIAEILYVISRQQERIPLVAINSTGLACRHLTSMELRRNAYKIDQGKTAVLIGGLGDIGRAIARHLFRQGGRKFAFIGSRPFEAYGLTGPAGEDWRSVFPHSSELAAPPYYAQADISNEEALARALEDIRGRLGPLHIVVQAAGRFDKENRSLRAKTEVTRKPLYAAKIEGTLLLDKLTRQDPVEMFILISSISAISAGLSGGQVDYAAANGFLHGYAWMRAQERPGTLCIALPQIRDTGMSKGRPASERLRALGIGEATCADLEEVLPVLLQPGEPSVRIWLPEPRPSSAQGTAASAPVTARNDARHDRVGRMAAADEVLATVVEIVSAAIGQQVGVDMATDRTLNDLGVDSLALADIVGRLERGLGCFVDPSVLSGDASLRAIAQALMHADRRSPESSDTTPMSSSRDIIPSPNSVATEIPAPRPFDIDRLIAEVRSRKLDPAVATGIFLSRCNHVVS